MKIVKEGFYGGLAAKVYEFKGKQFRFPWGTSIPDSKPLKFEEESLVFEDGSSVFVSFDCIIQSQLPMENPDVKRYTI